MRNITHVFFDLDHTLWDFKMNSRETLGELFHEMRLDSHGVQNVESFIESYERVNDIKWAQYRKGEIDKETLRKTRFRDALIHFEVDHPNLAHQMEIAYIERSPHKTNLFQGAHETLEYLREKYSLHIITNGFSEVQDVKLTKSGLKPFFETVITSEQVGVNKPDPKIFHHALHSTGAKRNQSVMVGDNLEADVRGARRAGLHSVFFNPEGQTHDDKVSAEIHNLKQLINLL